MAIFTNSSKQAKAQYNLPVYGMIGSYTLSNGIALPYFMAAMDINRLIDEIKIAEEVTPSLGNRWSLGELYQREVDRERVKRDIVSGYLEDPQKLKFFNAITVVLMPKDEDGKIMDDFPIEAVEMPQIPIPGDNQDGPWGNEEFCRFEVPGVQYLIAGDQARLRWNGSTVHAVAVDGQHRVVALREFKKVSRLGNLREYEQLTKIPVIILLTSPRLGFSGNPRPIRSISREVFTDLNKNAKTVDRAREIILDDLSALSLCLRTIITNETCKDELDKIPLSLIRWQDETNRFDKEYHLNSIVHLDLLLRSIINIKLPEDPMDKDDVTKFINEAAKKYSNGSLKCNDVELLDYYLNNYLDDEGNPNKPFFRIPSDYLNEAVVGFQAKYKPWLIRILTEFKPYKQVLDYARKNNLIEGTFGQYWSQTTQHRSVIKDEENTKDPGWFDREIAGHIVAIEEIKGKNPNPNWAFKAIFQKALVRLAHFLEIDNNDPILGNSLDLIGVLDDIYDKGLLEINKEMADEVYSVWAFVALNPGGGTIKVNKKTEDRIFQVLKLWYYTKRLIHKEKEKEWTATKIYNHFYKQSNVVEWPSCINIISELKDTFDVVGFHGDKLENIAETVRNNKVRSRIEKLISLAF